MSLSGLLKERVTLVRVFGALLALYIVLKWVVGAGGLATLVGLVLTIVGAVLAFRLCRHVLRKFIWRLRNRLMVTWLFIGVVPIVLILALAVLGTWIVVGQVAVYLVSSGLERQAASLADPVRLLIQARPADRPALVRQTGDFLAARMPGFQILVSGDQTLRYPAADTVQAPAVGWKDYTGYIVRDGLYYAASVARTGGTTVIALAPITRQILEKIVPGIGALNIRNSLVRRPESQPGQPDHITETTRRPSTAGSGNPPVAGSVPPPYNGFEWLDFETTWPNQISVASWEDPHSASTAFLVVTTRPSAVLTALFSNGIDSAQLATVLFVVMATLLLSVWLVSIVIGLSLTRTITSAVHGLYEGTLRIAKGDFSLRIPVKGRDQLSDLGRSFNNMTAQLEHLVVVAREKERLQSEVAIASEVQNQLFPRAAPAMKTIELVGICQPARMVSGDYYDYLRLLDGNLAVAIGDVAGKGISAALLMASIQSIVRTQLAAGLPVAAAMGNGHATARFSTSSIVAQLNRQLYASTAPEKFATFFFGAYDEGSRTLTYTNAGHVQPLLLRGGEVRLLEVTGTVVGAFPSVRYEEQSVDILPDDLLIAYTDGITEPENAYGEEFGADRLAETALLYQNREPNEIAAKIMEAVRHWSTAPELPDDMTVIIARGLA